MIGAAMPDEIDARPVEVLAETDTYRLVRRDSAAGYAVTYEHKSEGETRGEVAQRVDAALDVLAAHLVMPVADREVLDALALIVWEIGSTAKSRVRSGLL